VSRILSIAWRDFKATVVRKAFLLGVLGIPLLIVGVMVVAAGIIIQHEEPPLIGTVIVVDTTGEMTAATKSAFTQEQMDDDQRAEAKQAIEAAEQLVGGQLPTEGLSPSMPLKRGVVNVTIVGEPNADDDTIATLRGEVQAGKILAVAILDEGLLAAPGPDEAAGEFELFVAKHVDTDHTSLIERRIGRAVVDARTARAGVDIAASRAMLRAPRSQTSRISETGEARAESEDLREVRQMLVPMAFMMLLWIAVFTSGQHLLMSTIEEKSNRVMEVLLSAVSPLQLMTGKILGQGGVGLLIMLIYSSLGMTGLIMFALMNIIDPSMLVYLFVYFFMAYFMVASIMAAVGSAVSDIREANTLMTPVMLLLMVPLMLWMPITQAPNGAVATAFSFIPPTIPFAMILRVAADEPVPMWQIPATMVWGWVCVVGMVWMASKIFRVGVLMYGKPPSPVELIKWLRYS
jgi:ABC-2 type transport system permease protein